MIITVASRKGGVGKTTTALHLAVFFAQKGKTILADGDVNLNASRWFDRATTPTEEPIFKVVSLKDAAQVDYKYLIVDTPGNPSDRDFEKFSSGSDLLVVPSLADAFALEALADTIAMFKEIGCDRFKVLLTAVPPAPSKEGKLARETLTNAGVPLFKRSIRRYAAYGKAARLGLTVQDLRGASQAWDDYDAIGKEILRELKK